MLAAGSAIMAAVGWTLFHEGSSFRKVLGLALSVAALFLLKGE